jgi:CheY-like chemotaxis protein
MSAMSAEVDLDLDFTKILRVPAALRAPAVHAAVTPKVEAPVPQPAPQPAAPVAKQPPASVVCYARAAARPAPAGDAPVIVVEDHEPSRRMMEKLLQLQGFKVRAAADSREFAREMRLPPLPCLILLDVGLPRVNGFQILGHLRQHPQTSRIPVVLVTAHTADKEVMRGLSLGAEGYLSKPVSVKALQAVIETVLWKQ